MNHSSNYRISTKSNDLFTNQHNINFIYFQRYDIKTKGGLDDDKQKIIDTLQHRIKQLEPRNKELEVYFEKGKDDLEKYKHSTGTSGKNEEEISFLKNKLKLVEENYQSMKTYSEENWNKMMEKEKVINELKNEVMSF